MTDDRYKEDLKNALDVLATVRSGYRGTPRVQLQEQNEQLKKELKQLRDEKQTVTQEEVRSCRLHHTICVLSSFMPSWVI